MKADRIEERLSRSKSLSLSTVQLKTADYDLYNRLSKVWIIFSIIFSIHITLNLIVLCYSSSLMSLDTSSISLGLFSICSALHSISFANAFVNRVGVKYSLIIMLVGTTILFVAFYVAAINYKYHYLLCIIGYSIAGLTFSLGDAIFNLYYKKIGDEIVDSIGGRSGGKALQDVQQTLSSKFNIVLQSILLVSFLLLSILPLLASYSLISLLGLFVALSSLNCILGLLLFDSLGLSGSNEVEWQQDKRAIRDLLKADARVLLIMPYYVSFSVSLALICYFYNDVIITNEDSPSVGEVYLGLCESFVILVSSTSSVLFRYVATQFIWGPHFIVQFGTICSITITLFLLLMPIDALRGFINIIILKGLLGLNIGCFLTAGRSIISTHFATGESMYAAQSLSLFFSAFTGGIFFFLINYLNISKLSTIVISFGVFAVLVYHVFMRNVERGDDDKKPITYSHLVICCCENPAYSSVNDDETRCDREDSLGVSIKGFSGDYPDNRGLIEKLVSEEER